MQVLFIAKCKYYLRKENRVKLKPCQKGLVICGLAKTVNRRHCDPAETASTGNGLIQLGPRARQHYSVFAVDLEDPVSA